MALIGPFNFVDCGWLYRNGATALYTQYVTAKPTPVFPVRVTYSWIDSGTPGVVQGYRDTSGLDIGDDSWIPAIRVGSLPIGAKPTFAFDSMAGSFTPSNVGLMLQLTHIGAQLNADLRNTNNMPHDWESSAGITTPYTVTGLEGQLFVTLRSVTVHIPSSSVVSGPIPWFIRRPQIVYPAYQQIGMTKVETLYKKKAKISDMDIG